MLRFRLLAVGIYFTLVACTTQIDRHALVSRHNVLLTEADTLGSLSVGNGEFTFTVDASGLQTFPKEYENGISLGTQSQWAWHSIPSSEKFTLNDVVVSYTSCDSVSAPYPVQGKEGKAMEASNFLRANPHRLHLGIVGLILKKNNGEEVRLSDLKNIHQELDLWTGKIESTFTVEGSPVRVIVYAHQQEDRIAAKVESSLISKGLLSIKIEFPYGKECHVCPGYDWEKSDRHHSTIADSQNQGIWIKRQVDSTIYFAGVNWNGNADFKNPATHRFELIPNQDASTLEFSVLFSKPEGGRPLDFNTVKQNSENGWNRFWSGGGAIDFSECTDPRAKELERRVILSQYLTRIQCAGSLPPQETGLTMNSWYGKFHLEMHWWHGTHFALWDRPGLLEKSMNWYTEVLPNAKATAGRQHYTGARWQKMTDPVGNESPSSIGAFIIWQQPHPIYFAELLYRAFPGDSTLNRYRDLVFETADFMASFLKKRNGQYHLCHPLIPAQEIFKAEETDDPAYELQYWYFGIQTAQQWRQRLGMKKNEEWEKILKDLSPLVVRDGLYLPNATTPDAYLKDTYRRDHPAVLGALGFLPYNDRLDTAVMKKTLKNILGNWQWETTWGWDFPLMAMTAARLDEPDLAIDALMMNAGKNTYLINGHNYQDKRLRLYLPGNGGILAAVAMMSAGWDGCERPNPGFPQDGKWNLRWEGLKRMP